MFVRIYYFFLDNLLYAAADINKICFMVEVLPVEFSRYMHMIHTWIKYRESRVRFAFRAYTPERSERVKNASCHNNTIRTPDGDRITRGSPRVVIIIFK